MLSLEARKVDLYAEVSQLLERIILSRQKSADIVQGTALNQLHQGKEGQRVKSTVCGSWNLLSLFSRNVAIDYNQAVSAVV